MTQPQPKDGHRMERPVITRTVPTTIVVSKCECGQQRYEGRDRYELRAQHRSHRKARSLA